MLSQSKNNSEALYATNLLLEMLSFKILVDLTFDMTNLKVGLL